MQKALHAEERKLKDVFSRHFEFSIPGYQRAYSWSTDHAAQLLDDLNEAATKIGDIAGDGTAYFLGSIVLIKGPETAPSDVVDGQQRLTTLTILLSILRDLASPTEQPNYHELVFQKGSDILGTRDHYRLRLRHRDQNFFQTYVQELGATSREVPNDLSMSDSQKRIIANRDHLADLLHDWPEQRRKMFMKFLVQNCYLVVVAAVDQDAAFKIFSVMNNRGLDLSPVDILKSETISRVPETYQDAYTNKWEALEDTLGRKQFVNLLQHVRTLISPDAGRTLVEDIKRHFDNSGQSAVDFIDKTVVPMSYWLERVLNEDIERHPHARAINTTLGHLNRVGHTDWIPAFLTWFFLHGTKADETLHFVDMLDKFTFALELAKLRKEVRRLRYLDVMKAVTHGTVLDPLITPLILTPDEKRLAIQNLNGEFYSEFKMGSIGRTILLRLDESFSSGAATYDHDKTSIEHVLPQDPPAGSEWLKWFPDRKMRESYVHRLGNLVLLPRRQNSRARNYEFDRKKNEYFSKDGTSVFALTSQVLHESEWTPETIARRQQQLIARATQLWGLEGAGLATPATPRRLQRALRQALTA